MNPKPLPFPYEPRRSSLVGPLRRPVAQVALYSAAFHRWIAYTLVVDTGADYCVFPWELVAPAGFVEREDLPPLLGRYRCLDVFDLRLRQFVTTFSALPPSR